MSFGEGDLHEKLKAAEERADMYRRQLGGQTAAHARRKKENERLRRENAELRSLAYDMAVRAQTLENITEIAVLDARFYERMDGLGIEVER